MKENIKLLIIQFLSVSFLLLSKLLLAFGFNIGWIMSGIGYIFTNYFNYVKKLKIIMVTVSLMIFVSFYGFYKSQIGVGSITKLDWSIFIITIIVTIYIIFLQLTKKELSKMLIFLQVMSTLFGITAWATLSFYGKNYLLGWILLLTSHFFIGSLYLKLGKSIFFVALQVISILIAAIKIYNLIS